MIPELRHKIAVLNFWNANRALKPLLFALVIELMVLLHQLGIVVMVR